MTEISKTVSPSQLAEWKAAAEKATAGPWVTQDRRAKNQPILVGHLPGQPHYRLCSVHQPYGQSSAMEHNAAFIAAANPSTILKLIEAARGGLQGGGE